MGGTGPDLVADQDDVVAGQVQPLEGRANLDGRERRVRPTGHGDAVFAGSIEQDQCDTGRLGRVGRQAADVDPFRLQGSPCLDPERIVADGSDEHGGRTEARCRNGLVGPFAALMPFEPAADHRLARGRATAPP